MANYQSNYTGAQIDDGIKVARAMADYIVEQGTTNGWLWRKWNSGIGECWIRNTHSVAFSSQWGSLYETSSFPAVSYPFTFVELPMEYATPANPTLGCWVEATGGAGQTVTNTTQYQLIRPAKDSTKNDQSINIYAIGRWK